MGRIATVAQTGKQIFAELTEKNVTFMAAGIAYNAFISLAPLLIILVFVLSAVGGGIESQIIDLSQQGLPGPIADVITGVLEGEANGSGASFVGIIVLVWGTLKIFRGLDTAFSEIYETTRSNSFLDKFVDALIVFISVLIAVVATVGTTAVFARYANTIPFVGYITPIILIFGLIVAFFPMYYRFPDTDVHWQSVLPGVVFAAIGWAAFQAIFQVYLAFTGGDTGSFFGGVLVVITWLYFSGLLLLVGAVINAVIGGHSSGKSGGVGRGATGFQTEFEESMSLPAFSSYLESLLTQLGAKTTDPQGATSGETDRFPAIDGDVTVIEQSASTDDARKYAVSFRWETPTSGHDRSADDPEGVEAERTRS